MIAMQFVRVKGLKPRVDVFTRKLHNNMIQLWKDATKAFVTAIIEEDLIKVDTGMSKSSLLPLGRAVQMVTAIRAGINPQRDSRKGVTNIDGSYSPTQYKSAALGEKLGQKAFTLNFGSPTRPVFQFTWRIVVYQYWLNESSSNSIKSQNWHTLETGQKAFIDYLREHAPSRVPKLAEWLEPITGLI